MKPEGFVSMPVLLVGTATTAVSGAAAQVAEVAATYAEPAWLPLALKYMSFGAGLATLIAAAVNVYLGIRRDQREARASANAIRN